MYESIKRLFYKIVFCFVRNKYRRKQLYICLAKVGIAKYLKLAKLSAQESQENKQFKYFASIACIIKNEGPYLKEWIEYHKLIGVEHFYVYDNESTDTTKEILKPYIDSGMVTYIYYPGRDKQDAAYLDACRKYGDETKWMVVIDLDEFIVLHKTRNLREFMAEFSEVSQVSLHWVIYGSSGFEKKPDGLVLENFKGHARFADFTPKSIFNPRAVADTWPHYMWVCGKWVNENHQEFGGFSENSIQKAQVNHYVIKSWEEFYNRKVARGRANGSSSYGNDLREYFNKYDKNDVYDELMLPYVEQLKSILD